MKPFLFYMFQSWEWMEYTGLVWFGFRSFFLCIRHSILFGHLSQYLHNILFDVELTPAPAPFFAFPSFCSRYIVFSILGRDDIEVLRVCKHVQQLPSSQLIQNYCDSFYFPQKRKREKRSGGERGETRWSLSFREMFVEKVGKW